MSLMSYGNYSTSIGLGLSCDNTWLIILMSYLISGSRGFDFGLI